MILKLCIKNNGKIEQEVADSPWWPQRRHHGRKGGREKENVTLTSG